MLISSTCLILNCALALAPYVFISTGLIRRESHITQRVGENILWPKQGSNSNIQSRLVYLRTCIHTYLPYLKPYLTLRYLTLPCLALPCLALPCLALPYPALPYPTLPYPTPMPCHAMPCHVSYHPSLFTYLPTGRQETCWRGIHIFYLNCRAQCEDQTNNAQIEATSPAASSSSRLFQTPQ